MNTSEQKVFVAAKAVIRDGDKYLIFFQKPKDTELLDLPGGKIAFGEDVIDTLKREVKEEADVDVNVIDTLRPWHFFRVVDGNQVVCITFLCEIKDGDINLDNNPVDTETISGYKWMTKKEILDSDGIPHESFAKLFESLGDK
jgi:8-oxo-dGTP diphosphatase